MHRGHKSCRNLSLYTSEYERELSETVSPLQIQHAMEYILKKGRRSSRFPWQRRRRNFIRQLGSECGARRAAARVDLVCSQGLVTTGQLSFRLVVGTPIPCFLLSSYSTDPRGLKRRDKLYPLPPVPLAHKLRSVSSLAHFRDSAPHQLVIFAALAPRAFPAPLAPNCYMRLARQKTRVNYSRVVVSFSLSLSFSCDHFGEERRRLHACARRRIRGQVHTRETFAAERNSIFILGM